MGSFSFSNLYGMDGCLSENVIQVFVIFVRSIQWSFPFCFIACIIGIMKTSKLASSMRFLFLFEWQRLRIETSLFNLYYAYPQPRIDIPNMSTKTVFRDIFQLNLCTFSHARTKHTKDHATILPFTTVVQYSFLGIAR